MPRNLGVLALALLWLIPLQGRAETCSAAAALARIHDAYLALGDPNRHTRERAAIALLALHLPEADASDLATALAIVDPPPDEARLARIFLDAAAAAQTVAGTGRARLPPGHAADMAWLADTVILTGCADAWPAGPPAAAPAEPRRPPLRSPINTSAGHLALIALAGCAALGIAGLRRTRLFRRGELRRQPRNAVLLGATARTADGESSKVKVLDLSLGGMKISLRDAPAPGASLALEIGDRTFPASIAWRNDFYAGILLDTPLTKRELKELLSLNTNPAGGRQAQASR